MIARVWPWAGEVDGASQVIADSSIVIADSDSWDLPAGWMDLVNCLHRQVFEVLGPYEIWTVDQKLIRLRFRVSVYDASEHWDQVDGLVRRAWAESGFICDFCGVIVRSSASYDRTRCTLHRSERVGDAIARPPRW